MAHAFLSDEWMAAADAIRDRYADQTPPPPVPVRMNMVVTDVPFGEGEVRTYLDTTSGTAVFERGELDNAEVTLTTDYETAKAIFVEGTAQAGMQAFMAGKVRVDGDLAKLIAALQQVNPGAFQASEVQRRIQQITA